MLKKYVTLMLTMFFMAIGFGTNTEAKALKKKSSIAKNSKKKMKKKYKNRMSKRSYKRSGNGPDLRALTTASPETQYTENTDNGINSVETKPGL